MEYNIHNLISKSFIPFLLLLGIAIICTNFCFAAADVIYVNGSSGNDSWDGSHPIHTGGSIGPKATIQNGTDAVNSNGTVHIANGIYQEHLLITKDVNLLGQSQMGTILDGTRNGTVLIINPGFTVSIINLTLRNGTDTNCSGIYNRGTLNITNCTITNNTANGTYPLGGFGGGIYNGGILNVSHTLITHNQATSPLGGWGGGIYNNGYTTVIDSVISNNFLSYGFGGGIYNYQGSCTITRTTIENNTAYCGGGIDSYVYLTLTDSILKNNTATYIGGGLCNYGPSNILNSTIQDNQAQTSGGGIRNNGNIIIINSIITKNTAQYGGGIHNNLGYVGVNDLNCVYGNTPDNVYGNPLLKTVGVNLRTGQEYISIQTAINEAQNGDTIHIKSGIIYENLLINKNINLQGADNNTEINGHQQGSVITIPQGLVNITSLIIKNGWATYGGGINNQGTCTLTNCTLINNHALNGSAIYNQGQITLHNCHFNNNTAINGANGEDGTIKAGNGGEGGSGGAIYNTGNLNINNSLLTNNNAGNGGSGGNGEDSYSLNNDGGQGGNGGNGGSGGAIYNTGNLNINNSLLTNNNAGIGGNGGHGGNGAPGGLFYPPDTNGGNGGHAGNGGSGGAIYNTGNLTINNSTLNNNTAPYGGSGGYGGKGGIGRFGGDGGNGGAGGSGGGIYNIGNITVTKSTVTNNNAGIGGYGGKAGPGYGYGTDGNPGIAGNGGGINNIGSLYADKANFVYANSPDNVYGNQIQPLPGIEVAHIHIQITADNNHPKVGETFIITYKLGNKGPNTAKNVIATLILPEGFEIKQITGDGNWTYHPTTRTITWTLGEVPVGDPYLYLSGHIKEARSYVFGSLISSDTFNINTENSQITINATSEIKTLNSSIRTIGMQNTGTPINILILAILVLLTGLATVKRK